jgi:hypothetical protein
MNVEVFINLFGLPLKVQAIMNESYERLEHLYGLEGLK